MKLQKIFCNLVILGFVLVFLNSECLARNYYLSPNGSDSGDGSIEHPWASLDYALCKFANDNVNSRVGPGDTLYLRGGVYHVDQMTKYHDTSYHKGNLIAINSNEDSPLTIIKSYPGEWAILDGGGKEPALSTYRKQYRILIENVEVRNCHTVGFKFGDGYDDHALANSIIRNVYFHDNTNSNVNMNPSGMHLSGHSCVVEYCTFENNGTPGSSHYNSTNLLLYNSYSKYPENDPRTENIIRYCVFIGSGACLKDKGDMNLTSSTSPDTVNESKGNEIHHNIFVHPLGMAIAIISDFARIHHNLVMNGAGGFRLYTYEMHDATIWYPKIYNNTFINMTNYAIALDDQPNIPSSIYNAQPYRATIKNNVIVDCTSDSFIFWTGQATRNYTVSSNYNFWNNSFTTVGRKQMDSKATLEVWQGYGYGHDSRIGPVYFVDRSNNDYRLANGSIGKNAGDDGKDAGAFGEKNWYEEAGYKRSSTSSPPIQPNNLHVID